MVVPEDLIRLSDTGLAVIVGTRDAAMNPALSRGWGVRVLPGGAEIEVCVPLGSGAQVLENIAATGDVAITIVQPTTYRSFQVKGRGSIAGALAPEEAARVERHQQAFIAEVAAIGMAGPEAARLFDAETVPGMAKIRVRVDSLFDQTPGPGAGARL